MEAETGGSQSHRELEEAGEILPSSLQREHGPAHAPMSEPVQEEAAAILSPLVCGTLCGRARKLTQAA